MNWTTCKTCGRIVFVKDVDSDGNCIEHAKPKVEKK